MSARSPIGSAVATTRGDDGTTGLLFGGPRIPKDDPRAEAYGTIDEAVAALGVARAAVATRGATASVPGATTAARGAAADTGGGTPATAVALPPRDLGALLLRLQRELFVVGADLATTPQARDRLEDGRTRVSAAMVRGIEELLLELEAAITMPKEFVVPGETPASAALEVARTIVRRAERRAVALRREGHVPGDHLLPYLNRLADLLWVLARAAEQAEAKSATPATTTTRVRATAPAATKPARIAAAARTAPPR